jgi:hypothetical protein
MPQWFNGARVIYKGPGTPHGRLGTIGMACITANNPIQVVYWDSAPNGYTELEPIQDYLELVIKFEVLSVVKEINCATCSKTNDVGVKSCWWCGNNPQ